MDGPKTYECAAFNEQNSQNIFWGGHSPFPDLLCEEGHIQLNLAPLTPLALLTPLVFGPLLFIILLFLFLFYFYFILLLFYYYFTYYLYFIILYWPYFIRYYTLLHFMQLTVS